MTEPPAAPDTESARGSAKLRRARRLRRAAFWFAVLAAAYLGLAYVALPLAWTHHERQPGLAGEPMRTRTAQGIPGDPLNIGLVGSREDVVRALHAAGWYPADPITLRTSVEIVGSVLLDRPYRSAPVSDLFYKGRKQDLAFEKPSGKSADRRHHVRLWLVLDSGAEERPVWLGSATFDRGVGVSHYTGAVTHHIAPDIDAERSYLIASLTDAHMARQLYQVTGIGPTLNGYNGGGDRFYTDGEIHIAVLTVDGAPTSQPPVTIAAPAFIQFKDQLWSNAKSLLPDTADIAP